MTTDQPQNPSERRRPTSLSTVKDDLVSIFDNSGDTMTQATKLVRILNVVSDRIETMVKEIEALKMTEAQSAGQLTLVHDLVEQLTTMSDFSATGHTQTQNVIEDTSKKSMEILAGFIATLMDMTDILETIKVAVMGLTSQIQQDGKEHHCPWRGTALDETASPDLISNIARIVAMAPLLEITVADQLKQLGFNKDGKPREGFFVFFDKMKTTVINAAFMSVAAFLVGWLGVVLVNGKKAAMDQVRAELIEQHTKEIQQVRDERDSLKHKTEEQDALIQVIKKKVPAKAVVPKLPEK